MPHRYVCLTCNREFFDAVRPRRPKSPKYCSRKCYFARPNKPKRRIFTKVCELCGSIFYNVRQNARFCSRQCSSKSRRKDKPRTCEYCSKKFYVQPSHADRFCSWDCYNKARNENTKKTCPTCGKEFRTFEGNQNDVYCSRECWHNRPKTGIWKPCKNCGKDFYICKSHAERTFFCSRDCRLTYQGATSIEQLLLEEFDRRDIAYKFQYYIGSRFVLDFAIPEIRLAIEADGVYWHSLPENQERDKRKDNYLRNQDWTILRFSGDEIRQSPAICIDKVLNRIHLLNKWVQLNLL